MSRAGPAASVNGVGLGRINSLILRMLFLYMAEMESST